MFRRRQPASAEKHVLYHELLEQLSQPGCAVCRLGAASAARLLESLCGECVTDPDARTRWRESFGVCAPHARQLDALAPRLTLAILYEDLVRRTERELAAPGKPGRFAPSPCPACAAARRQEETSVRVLAEGIDEAELAEAYRASPGLCREHILALCARLPEPARRRVIAEETERLQRLQQELAEVQRKHDYRYSREPWGEEKTAPTRAVSKITGDREPE